MSPLTVPVLFDITIVRELSSYCIQELFPTQTRREQFVFVGAGRFCAAATLYIFHIVEQLFIEIFRYLKTLGEGDVELQL